ncbi:MAG: hypothetical protein ACRD2D_11855, partial [Terriglobales bacterium]
LGGIAGHAETQRIDASFMHVVKKLEALAPALLGVVNGIGLVPAIRGRELSVQNGWPPYLHGDR